MSWSYKIILAYTGFLSMMFYFVYVASQQNNELVDSHYYEKEKQFAQTLIGIRNLDSMGYAVSLRNDAQFVTLAFTKESVRQMHNGVVDFICLSDKSKDLHMEINLDSTSTMVIPANKFIQAQYQVRVEWMNNDLPLAFREKFYFLRS